MRAWLLLLLSACASRPDDTPGAGDAGHRPDMSPPRAPEPVPSRLRVGTSGATLASPDQRLVVVIPSGALTATTPLEIIAGPTPGTYRVEPATLALARPLILRWDVSTSTIPWSGLRIGVGVGDEFAALPAVGRASEQVLTAWTWSGGTFSLLDRRCRAVGNPVRFECGWDDRERCVLDPRTLSSDVCAIPCAEDGECPLATACMDGRCQARTCDGDEDCGSSGETCSEFAGAGLCTPKSPPQVCGACEPGQRCIEQRGRRGALAAVCGQAAPGCSGVTSACLLRSFDAWEGFIRSAEVPAGALWSYFVRFSQAPDELRPLTAYARHDDGRTRPGFKGSTWLHTWTDQALQGAVVFANDALESARGPYDPRRTFDVAPVSLVLKSPGASPLFGPDAWSQTAIGWRAPFAGRLRVDLSVRFGPIADSNSRGIGRLEVFRPGGARTELAGPPELTVYPLGPEVRASKRLDVHRGDELRLSCEQRVQVLGGVADLYSHWVMTYEEVVP